MLSLSNAHMLVAVLDPVADQARFGARYCTGGYIYQITDQRCGDLLSGPTYPFSFNWFDGQGIPDSFRTHLVDPVDTANPFELGIGIGLVKKADGKVTEFCRWQVTETNDTLTFETTQSYQGWAFTLTRSLRLQCRSLISETRLKNTGKDVVPINWFPHPFFPHYETGEACKCNLAVRLPDSPGYELLPNGFIKQKNLPWGRGFFHELDFDKGQPLTVLQKHPKLGLLGVSFSYAPTYFPIWGNKNTFSFEPYLQTEVAPGAETAWTVTYDL
jgi:hypothetical protein